ncbi:MAG: hypothetical protein KME12_10195 [Trichocoleus desertorum ATA4-8-CV12]|jgi:superfamily I DNA and RNA helicase|nr:hypothetical protein [Trichocoleus desertorum ATA4-8-CV12]
MMTHQTTVEILPVTLPREIPEGTAANSPIRVIQNLESQVKVLDENQQKIAFEYPDGPQRLRGLAGTGKTVLFAKRAAKIHAEHPDWNIAFVFFTRSLYQQIIEERIGRYYQELTGKAPNWEKLKVLHAWGAKDQPGFYRTLAIEAGVKPKNVKDVEQEIGKVSPAKAFAYVCSGLERQVSPIPCLYDVVLIDEGQDLPFAFYRLARNSLTTPKRLYWAYDEAQGIGSLTVPEPAQVFGRDADGVPVVDLGLGRNQSFFYEGTTVRKSENLNRCYRTPQLLLMAAQAVNMGLLRPEGPVQGVSNQAEWRKLGYEVLEGDFTDASVQARQQVTIARPADKNLHPIDQEDFEAREAIAELLSLQTFEQEAEEQEWIAQQIVNDLRHGLQPTDILVTALSGESEKQYWQSFQAKLAAYGIKSFMAGGETHRNEFMRPGQVTLANIHRAKGNEAWKVYACRFHWATRPLAWKQESELHKRNEAFVALTRSRVWCVVTGLDDPIFEELRQAKGQYPQLTFPAFNKASLRRVQDEESSEAELAPVAG